MQTNILRDLFHAIFKNELKIWKLSRCGKSELLSEKLNFNKIRAQLKSTDSGVNH